MKHNFKKVFKIFQENYEPVPLEVFGKDPYRTLISTLISSRTKDEVTLKASKKLFGKASNIYKLKNLSVKEIEKLIYPVGFYKTKAIHIKKLSEKVIRNYDGKVPKYRGELIKLPGVGRKTANLVLNRAFGKPAIAVDVHVHRISNLLGWVKTATPERTEKVLVKILPKKYWEDINRLCVSVGRKYNTKKGLINFLVGEELIDTLQ